MGRAEVQETQNIPALSFEFAQPNNRSSLGKKLVINPTLLDIPPISKIPDFSEPQLFGVSGSSPRYEYYRELVRYHFTRKRSEELAFLLRNDSERTISDIRVELVIEKDENKFMVFGASKYPRLPESHYSLLPQLGPMSQQIFIAKKPIEIQDLGDLYRIEVPFEKVQPKQTIFSKETIFIASNDSFSIDIGVTIYADNIPTPIKQHLEIDSEVIHEDGSLEHILELHQKYLRDKQN